MRYISILLPSLLLCACAETVIEPPRQDFSSLMQTRTIVFRDVQKWQEFCERRRREREHDASFNSSDRIERGEIYHDPTTYRDAREAHERAREDCAGFERESEHSCDALAAHDQGSETFFPREQLIILCRDERNRNI